MCTSTVVVVVCKKKNSVVLQYYDSSNTTLLLTVNRTHVQNGKAVSQPFFGEVCKCKIELVVGKSSRPLQVERSQATWYKSCTCVVALDVREQRKLAASPYKPPERDLPTLFFFFSFPSWRWCCHQVVVVFVRMYMLGCSARFRCRPAWYTCRQQYSSCRALSIELYTRASHS